MDTLYFRTHEGRRDESHQVSTVKEKDAKIAMATYDALNGPLQILAIQSI